MEWGGHGLIPEGLRLRRRESCAVCRHWNLYGINLLRTAGVECWRRKTLLIFSRREPCRNPAAKLQHLTRCFLIFRRLGRCRRAFPVADVLVKVKPVLNLDHNSRKCAYRPDRHAGPLPLQYIEEHPAVADNYARSVVPTRTW